jgi:hypothetical protein
MQKLINLFIHQFRMMNAVHAQIPPKQDSMREKKFRTRRLEFDQREYPANGDLVFVKRAPILVGCAAVEIQD